MLLWWFSSLLILFLGFGGVAFVTLLERKMLGLSQIRLGPNKVTLFGVIQPVMDGIKLMWKELYFINSSYLMLFCLSPVLLLSFFSFSWIWVIPWVGDWFMLKYSSLFYFSLLGLSAYSIILTGWSTVSNFSKLGSLRGLLQSLSFEVALIFIFFIVLTQWKSFSLKSCVVNAWEMNFIWLILWVFVSLMETNRAPFDLLEGESELISGFNIEMGSLMFIFLFLSEYGMILVMSFISSLILNMNMFLVSLVLMFIIFMRSCFPRIRYDIMMMFMWLCYLPFIIVYYSMVMSVF